MCCRESAKLHESVIVPSPVSNAARPSTLPALIVLTVQGLGFRVQDSVSGFGVLGSGSRVQSLGFWGFRE